LYESLDAPGAVFASCSNADGSFWIGDVVPGSYVVAVADPSGVHATYWGDAPVVVDAGSAALELVLTPIAEGTVSGVVTGAGGPVSGACVYLYADASDQGAVYATCTGPDGGYWLSGVAAGEYTVAVADWSGAHATYWAETVTTVAPGAGVTVDVTLVAVASGGVSGTITSATGPGGVAAGGVCVYLYDADRTDAASFASCSLADGGYAVSQVVSGDYDVAFFDPAGGLVTQWWTGAAGGAASQAGAVEVTVGDSVLTGIDAELAPVA
jgi:hypothetical protein